MNDWTELVKNAIAALVILLAISVVLFLAYLGLDAANSSGEKIVNTTTAMDMRSYDTYNQTTIKGSTVLSAVKNYQNQPVGVVVQTKAKDVTNYNALLDTGAPTAAPTDWSFAGTLKMNDENSGVVLDDLNVFQDFQNLNTQTATDKSLPSYINPSANFKSVIIFNANGEVIGLYMEQVGVESGSSMLD